MTERMENIASGRKGLASVISGVFMLFMVVMGMVGISIYFAGSADQVSVQMSDLESLSLASTYGDYHENEFMPQALRLSEHRGVYQAGQQGSILWTEYQLGYSDSQIFSHYDDFVSSNISHFFNNYVTEAESQIACSFEEQKDVEISEEKLQTVDFDEKTSVSCSARNSEVSYIIGDASVENSTRGFTVFNGSHAGASEINESVEKSYSTSREDVVFCKDVEDEVVEVEENLEDDLIADLRSGLGSGESKLPDGVYISDSGELEIEDCPGLCYPADDGRSCRERRCPEDENIGCYERPCSEDYRPAITTAVSISMDTDLEVGGVEIDPITIDNIEEECSVSQQETTIKIDSEISEFSFEYDVRDEKRELITSDGFRNLEFSAVYNHEFN